MGRRVICVWFPALPVNRLMRKGLATADAPLAVLREEKNALRLVSLTPAAQAAGLVPGMSLADARAVLPDLATRLAEPEAEAALLSGLHRWAGHYSPSVGLAPPDALLLDSTGCAHLFGGEAAMLAQMAEDLARLQMTVRLGLADTKRAAMALARFGAGTEIAPPGAARARLADFPVAALEAGAEVTTGCRRLGLERIGQLLDMPRAGLARRFGIGLVRRLDELTGAGADPVAPLRPRPVFAARLTLPEPIGLAADVSEAVRRLTEQLCRRLEIAQMGARRICLQTGHTDHSTQNLPLGFARPTREAALMQRLFAPLVEKLDAGFGIERLRLFAEETEPLSPRQQATHEEAHQGAALDDVLARLGNRLGFERIAQYQPGASHLPSRAFWLSPAGRTSPPSGWPVRGRCRPLTRFRPEPAELLAPGRPPGKFSWRREICETAAARGPERLLPEWWRSGGDWPGGARDYWWVETTGGLRLWLYNEPGSRNPENWFVEGIFP